MSSTTPRSIVVTGTNKGIGYEAVKLLAQKLPECTVYLTARSQANGEGAVEKMKENPSHSFDNVKIILLEVTDSSSIEQAVAAVNKQSGMLDVLLHNSGILEADGNPGSPKIFDVNVRAVKHCIEAFSAILTKDTGKIIVVSSEVGTWATHRVKPELKQKLLDIQNTSWEQVEAWSDDWQRHYKNEPGVKEGWQGTSSVSGSGYSVSKALLNAYLRHYVLKNPDVKLAIVCPGYCATELNGWSGPRSAEQGGESVIWPIFNDFKTGHFYQDGKEMEFSSPALF